MPLRPLIRLGVTAIALAAIGGCSPDLGDGNRLERVGLEAIFADPTLELEKLSTGETTAKASRCFRSAISAIGTFSDGSRENLSGRANFTSSNPAVIRVSNGEERDADGNRLGRGVITPVGAVGGQAKISVEFLGLRADVDVTIQDARLDISPPALEMAFGTTQLLTALGLIDRRLVVSAGGSVTWSVTNAGAAEATIDPVTGLLTATKGGPASADGVIVTADPRIDGCANFAAQLRVRINNRVFDRLDVRTEHLGNNPDPLLQRPLTQEGLRVFGVDESGGSILFEQDLTANIVRNQVDAITNDTEQVLVAEDPDTAGAATTIAGFFLSDVITVLTGTPASELTTDDARLRIRFDQDASVSGQLEESFIVRVPRIALSRLQIQPATRTLFPGTSATFTVAGTYTDNSTQDLTRNVSWSTSDRDIAGIGNPALREAFASASVDADNGSVTVDAQRTDPVSAAVIKASDSGGGATLTVSDQLASFAVEPASGTVPEGRQLALRAIGSNGQDLTNSVIWTSQNPAGAVVDNLFPNIGVVTGVSTSGSPVTINARLFRENSDDEVTDLSATATVTVQAAGTGGSGGSGGAGGSGGTGGAAGTGGAGGSGGTGGGGGGLCELLPIFC